MQTKFRITLGKNVVALRHERGITQEKLAELADLDRRYLQRIEAGTANPGIDVLARLKSSLKAGWTQLLDEN